MRVLLVCLGNICRSPMAEGVVRAKAAEAGLDWTVDSAGTGGWHVGEAPDKRAQAEARTRGYDLSAQRARQVEAVDFERFHLICAMDRDNLAALERARPSGGGANVKLFLDFADGPAGREVPDPYYEGGFDHALDLIETAADGLVASEAK